MMEPETARFGFECGKCGAEANVVLLCPVHGKAAQIHVATDPSLPGHGHHYECRRCVMRELYAGRARTAILEAAGELETEGGP